MSHGEASDSKLHFTIPTLARLPLFLSTACLLYMGKAPQVTKTKNTIGKQDSQMHNSESEHVSLTECGTKVANDIPMSHGTYK